MMSRAVRPVLAAQLLREGRTVDMPLGGASMLPLFAPGTTLRIEPATAATVHPGDVVVIDLDGALLVHRLLANLGSMVLTRGDDSPEPDPPLPATAIIGRVPVAPSPRALYAALRALLRA